MDPLYPTTPKQTVPLRLGEDAFRIFLYKPAGLPIFPPHADREGDCLLRWWLQNGGEIAGWPEGFAGGIAHRLDNRTSGLVVVARTPEDLSPLREQFSSGQLRKFYRLRSLGVVDFERRLCTLPIAHHARKSDRMVVQQGSFSRHRGKWYTAWTEFRREGTGIWGAEIRTGVMHQIRVHAAAVGLPLDGDSLYGGAPAPFWLEHDRIIGPGWEFSLPEDVRG